MESFPSRERFEHSVERGNALLARHGYAYNGTADELMAWLQTDTPYPNPEPGDLLDSPFLVVHEIVEIAEAKRLGLLITQDVIVRNLEKINDAHLVASQVEFRLAASERDIRYVEARFPDLTRWCEDPELNERQRLAYASFRDRVEGWLRSARTDRPTEGI